MNWVLVKHNLIFRGFWGFGNPLFDWVVHTRQAYFEVPMPEILSCYIHIARGLV